MPPRGLAAVEQHLQVVVLGKLSKFLDAILEYLTKNLLGLRTEKHSSVRVKRFSLLTHPYSQTIASL